MSTRSLGKEDSPLANWTEETVNVAGVDLAMIKGGAGKPLLILHEELAA
jgi:hypothetical protein